MLNCATVFGGWEESSGKSRLNQTHKAQILTLRYAAAKHRRKLLHFWRQRNAGEPVLLDQYSVNNVSFAVAWLGHVLNITPNQLSVLSGLFSLVAFAAALWLPAAELAPSLFWIFALAQLAYLLDCADGQLARATGQESAFGAFLDKGIDIAGSILVFGGFFAFLYRHFAAAGETDSAELSLAIGFLFLLARSSRFLAWQKFDHVYRDRESRIRKAPGLVHHVVVSLMEHQMSLLGIILFLAAPVAGFLLFAGQAVILAGAYVRYFVRAWRIERHPAFHEARNRL